MPLAIPRFRNSLPARTTWCLTKGWMPWVGKGSLAIARPGPLCQFSNFLLNVLLARWLAPTDYGAFALAFSVFLLLLLFHNALLSGPMLVFGPGKYRERFPEYLGILLRGHFALISLARRCLQRRLFC